MTTTAHYVQGSTAPSLSVFWTEPDGSGLIDFSSGWTFSIQVGDPGQAAATGFPITTGTGAVGSGTGVLSTDVPNLVVAWAAADLGSLAPGVYTIEIEATSGSDVRKIQIPLRIRSQVSPA